MDVYKSQFLYPVPKYTCDRCGEAADYYYMPMSTKGDELIADPHTFCTTCMNKYFQPFCDSDCQNTECDQNEVNMPEDPPVPLEFYDYSDACDGYVPK